MSGFRMFRVYRFGPYFCLHLFKDLCDELIVRSPGKARLFRAQIGFNSFVCLLAVVRPLLSGHRSALRLTLNPKPLNPKP